MNLKTTIVLILLVGAGAGGWTWLRWRQPVEGPATGTLDLFHNELTAAKIAQVEVMRFARMPPPAYFAGLIGMYATPMPPWSQVVAWSPRESTPLVDLKKSGNEWVLPGNWPTRKHEVDRWIGILTSLDTRFAPIPLVSDSDMALYGLEENALIVRVMVGTNTYTLRFGEKPGRAREFSEPTYVRLNRLPEVIQLGPGVYAALNRTQDYFQQRRLFPVERVAKEEGATQKVDQIGATAVEIATKDAKFALAKKNNDWILREAFKKDETDKKEAKKWKRICSEDRLDPARRDALLRGLADLWADKFVHGIAKTPGETGLNKPDFVITAKTAGGNKIKLLIGKVSSSSRKFVLKKIGPQMMPSEEVEEFRYARLQDNDQLFEMKTDKLASLGVGIDELRDAQLAHFKTDDVMRLAIQHGGQTLIFVKAKQDEKDTDSKAKWRMEKPAKEDIEPSAVEDLLDKLASAQARGKEILDDIHAKTVGLDAPAATVKITLEEIDKSAPAPADPKDAKKKKREITWRIGVKAKEPGKAYVRVDDWPRVNEVSEEIFKLASRPEVAYRPRELWKLERDAITKITIDGGKKPYTLMRGDKAWKITGPLEADASGPTVDSLADELASLKAERFEPSKAKDLAKFGLDKPAFKIGVTAKDGKPRALEIGKRVEAKEGGRYARLAGSDAVFVLSEKIAGALRADPFDLLDPNLLTLNPDGIERIRYQGESTFTLESQKGRWQIVGSAAGTFPVEPAPLKTALFAWAKLRADRFTDVGPKIDFAKYGLAKPSLTIIVSADPSEKGKLKKPVEHSLELGKQADGSGARYARLDKKDAVVVLDALTAKQIARTYLDFLDLNVLRLDGEAVMSIERKMNGADFELVRRDDAWQIAKPVLRDADNLTIFDILRSMSLLRASRIAAFPAKDLKPFGLDKPAAVVSFLLEIDGVGKKHVLKFGDKVKDADKQETGERYAIVDDQPKVVVLSAELSRHLTAPVLYFADRNLAAFGNVDRIDMARSKRKVVFSRVAGGWEMTQPEPARAESAALDDLLRYVQRLRADEIVADKAADLKKYGLAQPIVQWSFKAGPAERLHLLIGAAENAKPGARRYAKLADKNAIFLLSDKLSAKAVAEFRYRAPLPPFDAAKVKALIVTAGKEKPFTFEKKDDKWVLVGDAKAALKAFAVADAIEALASLKALHYVEDAKADLKQYGLATPAWKIEVQLPVGKRETWLGGFEDKSKRYFATVPGTGAIFVLSEFDGTSLARPRSGYLEAEKKK